jgi:hypothetical protein
MKFDVDYDEILKNRLLLKTKKIEGGGRFQKRNFFCKLRSKNVFHKNLLLGSSIILHKFQIGPMLRRSYVTFLKILDPPLKHIEHYFEYYMRCFVDYDVVQLVVELTHQTLDENQYE